MTSKSPINPSSLHSNSLQLWHSKLNECEATSEAQLKSRLDLLSANESELNTLITDDAEAFVDMKHALEEDATVLADQRQLLASLQQLNEVFIRYKKRYWYI